MAVAHAVLELLPLEQQLLMPRRGSSRPRPARIHAPRGRGCGVDKGRGGEVAPARQQAEAPSRGRRRSRAVLVEVTAPPSGAASPPRSASRWADEEHDNDASEIPPGGKGSGAASGGPRSGLGRAAAARAWRSSWPRT